ncbi:MAG: hypothetical protein GKR87_12740 [Kiritimatiellae bacterium]|nr:hypothetical protein [Kiritimatiellia bacterium]
MAKEKKRGPLSGYGWLGFSVVLIVSTASLTIFFERIYLKELIWSWVLTYSNASLTGVINKTAIGASVNKFFLWGLGIHGLRIFTVVLIIAMMRWVDIKNFLPFLTTTLIGYVCMLISEVLSLHLKSLEHLKINEQRTS